MRNQGLLNLPQKKSVDAGKRMSTVFSENLQGEELPAIVESRASVTKLYSNKDDNPVKWNLKHLIKEFKLAEANKKMQ